MRLDERRQADQAPHGRGREKEAGLKHDKDGLGIATHALARAGPAWPTGLIVTPRPKHFGAERGGYIGGTDIAPILGVSERTTRFAVWAKKVHADLPEDNTNAEERDAGQFYEPFILQRFAARFGVTVIPTADTYRLKDTPFLGANPDGLVYRGRPDGLIAPSELGTPLGGIDAKTRSPFLRGAWGEAGTADVPTDEMCQAQWYAHLLDLPVWYLAVFFDRQLSVFVLPRDRELGALMVEEATAFWNDFILPKKEPPFDGPAAADYLRRRYPRVTEGLRDATMEDDILVARRDLMMRHMKALKSHLEAVNNSLMKRIAEAEGIQGDGYAARWFETKAKSATGWKAVVDELRSFPVVADEKTAEAIRKQIDEAIVRHTTQGEGSRTFNVFFEKGPRRLPTVKLPELPESSTERNADGKADPS